MTVELYTNKSEPNRMNKTITLVKSVQVRLLTMDTEVRRPSLELSGNIPTDVNYFYIPTFKRYYYASDPVQLQNGMWRLDGVSDPLMSFKDAIRACSGIVARNEKKYNAYMQDPEIQSYQNVNFVTKAFPQGFRSDGVDYVMIVAGGGTPQSTQGGTT